MSSLKKPFPAVAILFLFLPLLELLRQIACVLAYCFDDLAWYVNSLYLIHWYEEEFGGVLRYAIEDTFSSNLPCLLSAFFLFVFAIILLFRRKNFANVIPLAFLFILTILTVLPMYPVFDFTENFSNSVEWLIRIIFTALNGGAWLLLMIYAAMLSTGQKIGKAWFVPGILFSVSAATALVFNLLFYSDTLGRISFNPDRIYTEFAQPLPDMIYGFMLILLAFAAFSLGKWFYLMADLEQYNASRVKKTPAPSCPQPAPVSTERPTLSAAEELKQYKELLDMGAITEEEYAHKKQQLLDL